MKRMATLWTGVALLAACAATARADVEAKLKALEAARKAGVLTDAEYARKKAALEAQRKAAQPDPATRKKLQALEAAYKAGVFTEAEYNRKKAQLLGRGAPDAPPPSLDRRKGKTYRHPVGFSFWHPADWTARAQEGFLQLIPPKPGSKDGVPTEVYGIVGERVDAEGITRPDDPRVIAFLDQRVRLLSPRVTRKGEPSPVEMARGRGVLLQWEGKDAGGSAIVGRAYAAIIRGYGVALAGVGLKDALAAREPDLGRMFASFGFGESQRDPRVVGRWLYEKHYFSGTFSSTTIQRLALRPDGTCAFGSRLLADQEHRDGGGNPTAWTNLDTGKDPGSRGRWAAGGGTLYLFWNDGACSESRYTLSTDASGRYMLTRNRSGRKMLWIFQGR